MTVNIDALFAETQQLFQSHRYDDSWLLIDKALSEEPDNVRLLQLTAEFAAATGNYERADQTWLTLTELAPDDSYYWCRRAEFALETGEFDQALNYLERSLALEETARAHLARVQAFMRSDRHEDAIVACDDALRVNAATSAAHLYKANCLTVLQKYEEALQQSALYIERDSNPDAAVILIRADCFEGLGELDKAIVELNKALALDYVPDAAYTRRALINYQLGNAEAAIADATSAMDLGCSIGHELACLQTRALAYAQLEQIAEALIDINEAITLDDDPQLLNIRNQILARAAQ